MISMCRDMTYKVERGIYLPRVALDCGFDEDEFQRYKFGIEKSRHHFIHDDRVVLCVYGRPAYQLATIDVVLDDGIVLVTDDPLDILEEYSIELVI